MEGTELVSFNIIAFAGDARSHYYEAIEYAKNEKFELAYEAIDNGKKSQVEAHGAHKELLTSSASGEDLKIDILLIHAEDQLMLTEVMQKMALEMINMYRLILEKNKSI